jgi:hypothetical protein
MKKYIFLTISIFIFGCSVSKGVYWCGDHPCINNKEKEAYFKKTMIVEVRHYNKDKIKDNSEIEKLLDQAKLDEKKRVLSEKELAKQAKIEEKELSKQIEIDEKKRIKEEKELSKQIEIDEKKRIKEEKELSKQIEIDEKKMINENSKLQKQTDLGEKDLNEKKIIKVGSFTGNIEISSNKFSELVEKINRRNSFRSYPDINDMPN